MVQPYGDLNIVFPCPAMNQRCLQHAFKEAHMLLSNCLRCLRRTHSALILGSIIATPVVWFRSSIASKSNLIAALSFQRRVLPHPLHAMQLKRKRIETYLQM